jgi:hypothetical protein
MNCNRKLNTKLLPCLDDKLKEYQLRQLMDDFPFSDGISQKVHEIGLLEPSCTQGPTLQGLLHLFTGVRIQIDWLPTISVISSWVHPKQSNL